MTPLEDFTAGGVIDAQRASRATEWLVHHAHMIGQARAERDRRDNLLKVVKSRMMLRSKETSAAMKETDALASEEYMEAVELHAEASATFEVLSYTASAAKTLTEVWRSINATLKGSGA